MRRELLLVVISACSFQHGALSGDAAGDDVADAPVDTRMIDAAPPTACIQKWLDGSVRLGSIDEIDDVDTASVERDPFLTADEKTLFFYSDRAGNLSGDVYKSTRTSTTDTWSVPAKFAAASTVGSESKMSMTDDGLYFVVASNLGGMSASFDILDATRASTGDNFTPLGRTYTAADCTGADELDPFVSADGLELYIAQNINGSQRIVRATRQTRSQPFGATSLVAELDSSMGDADPTLSADGRVILFSSNRTGDRDSSNLWYATRAGNSGPFSEPKPVPDANSDNQDGDPWLSHDGCRLYFSSTRSNDFDLWTATVE